MKIKFCSHWDHWRAHIILFGYQYYSENHSRSDIYEDHEKHIVSYKKGFEFCILGFGIIFYKEFYDEGKSIEWMKKRLLVNDSKNGEAGVLIKKNRITGSINDWLRA